MPGASLKPYDALFAASQRARKPVGAAAGAARNGMPWYDPLVPIAHGLTAPVLGGLGLGALSAAAAPEDARLEAGLISGVTGAAVFAPWGVESGLQVKNVRDSVRNALQEGATFGKMRDYAQRAQEHVTDPRTREAFKRYAAGGSSASWEGIWDERRVHHAFRRGMREVPQSEDALVAELRKEFPGLSDRQIAGKLHPDQRGATEAPAEGLDAAYQNFISRGRGKGPNQEANSPEAIARQFHAEGQNKALDFLHSWRGSPPEDLARHRKF